jgi:hypothetical protein
MRAGVRAHHGAHHGAHASTRRAHRAPRTATDDDGQRKPERRTRPQLQAERVEVVARAHMRSAPHSLSHGSRLLDVLARCTQL